MWPGSNYTYGGRATTFNVGFNPNMPLKARVDTALNWFVHDKTPANLVMLYIEEPDTHGHIWGPEAQIVCQNNSIKLTSSDIDKKKTFLFINFVCQSLDLCGHNRRLFCLFRHQITDTVAMLDQLCGYIQQKLIELGLDKRVNIVHLSDHGMASVNPPNFIDFRKFLTNGTYTTYGTSPILQVVPKSACEFGFFFAVIKRKSGKIDLKK